MHSPASEELHSITYIDALPRLKDVVPLIACIRNVLHMKLRHILLPVSFLATSVINPTVNDLSIVVGILMCINASRVLVQLNGDRAINIRADVDASLGVHDNLKSQIQVCLSVLV